MESSTTEKQCKAGLCDVIKQLAEYLQAASPLARRAVAPVLASMAESPGEWRDAAAVLASMVSPTEKPLSSLDCIAPSGATLH
jgi:hypothetical protein